MRSAIIVVLLVQMSLVVWAAPKQLPPFREPDPTVRAVIAAMIREIRATSGTTPDIPYGELWFGRDKYLFTFADGVVRRKKRMPPRSDTHRGSGLMDNYAYAVWEVLYSNLTRAANGIGQIVLRRTARGWVVVASFEGSEFTGSRAELLKRGVPLRIIRGLDMDVR